MGERQYRNSKPANEVGMTKRGRPIGARSWWRNPANIAAHHANVLLELWLAGVPEQAIRLMLSSLVANPEY
jgi:hypothetical protein